jgi:hypothetical protein
VSEENVVILRRLVVGQKVPAFKLKTVFRRLQNSCNIKSFPFFIRWKQGGLCAAYTSVSSFFYFFCTIFLSTSPFKINTYWQDQNQCDQDWYVGNSYARDEADFASAHNDTRTDTSAPSTPCLGGNFGLSWSFFVPASDLKARTLRHL